VLLREENGGWSSRHDEGRALRTLFGLLLHEQIFDSSVPDVFFAPLQGEPLDLHSPLFYAARKQPIDARLADVAAAPPSRLAELVRRAHATHHGKATTLVHWDEQERDAELLYLQQVAVCFGGRGLAGILLHLAATGTFSGMPDITMIKAARPDAVGDGMEPVPVDAWPLREVPQRPARVPLSQMERLGAADAVALCNEASYDDSAYKQINSHNNRQ